MLNRNCSEVEGPDRLATVEIMITTWTPQNDQVFTELLARWNHHQDLRTTGADIASLFESRTVLEQTREVARRSI